MAQNLKSEIDDLRDIVSGKQFHARVFATIHTMVEERIFKRGLDSDGRGIGRYSKGYLKTRKRKGYPTSNKVILQAENQMRNDFAFGVDRDQNFASGFQNLINWKKSKWVEKTYKKDIFSLTQNENKKISELLEAGLKKALG